MSAITAIHHPSPYPSTRIPKHLPLVIPSDPRLAYSWSFGVVFFWLVARSFYVVKDHDSRTHFNLEPNITIYHLFALKVKRKEDAKAFKHSCTGCASSIQSKGGCSVIFFSRSLMLRRAGYRDFESCGRYLGGKRSSFSFSFLRSPSALFMRTFFTRCYQRRPAGQTFGQRGCPDLFRDFSQ